MTKFLNKYNIWGTLTLKKIVYLTFKFNCVS